MSYIDGILSDMKAADRVGNTRELMRLRKTLSGKHNASCTMPTKDSNGDHILSQGSLLKAWNKFLAEKFDCPPSDLNRSREATVSPRNSLSDQELSEALASLKSGKAPGIDRIHIEAYQQSVCSTRGTVQDHKTDLGDRGGARGLCSGNLHHALQEK